MAFLPADRPEEGRAVVDEALATEDIGLLSWRVVPIDPAALSQRATASLPRIEQAIVAAPSEWDEETFERRLFLARKAHGAKGRPSRGLHHPVRFVPDRRLQGAVHRQQDRRVLLGPARPEVRDLVRHLPSAVLDEHLPVVVDRPAVPQRRPQRRDQHHPLQPGVDGGPGGERQVASMGRAHRRASPVPRARAVGLGQLGQCLRAAAADRPLAWPTSRRCCCRRPGRTSPTSIPTCAPSTSTTPSSPSHGTGQRRSPPPTAGCCWPPWTATGCDRRGGR